MGADGCQGPAPGLAGGVRGGAEAGRTVRGPRNETHDGASTPVKAGSAGMGLRAGGQRGGSKRPAAGKNGADGGAPDNRTVTGWPRQGSRVGSI